MRQKTINPRGYSKVKLTKLFKEWFARQDPKQSINYMDCFHCPLGRFARHLFPDNPFVTGGTDFFTAQFKGINVNFFLNVDLSDFCLEKPNMMVGELQSLLGVNPLEKRPIQRPNWLERW